MKRKTLTIAVSIYNEEDNILNFLNSVNSQKEALFKIEKILLLSDGSTDNTNRIIEHYHSVYPIHLIKGKKRLGKTQRLNQIFQSASSDYLVLFDADVVLSSPYTVRNLIQKLKNGADLVGGNPIPLPGKTIIENAINASCDVYQYCRVRLHNGKNVHNCIGRVLGLSSEFYHTIRLPKETPGNDRYLYFSCLKHGLVFDYCPNGVVYYRSPATFSDQIKQLTRFDNVELWMSGYFGTVIVKQELKIPRFLYFQGLLFTINQKPIEVVILFLLNSYIRQIYKGKKTTSIWSIAGSTKKIELNFTSFLSSLT